MEEQDGGSGFSGHMQSKGIRYGTGILNTETYYTFVPNVFDIQGFSALSAFSFQKGTNRMFIRFCEFLNVRSADGKENVCRTMSICNTLFFLDKWGCLACKNTKTATREFNAKQSRVVVARGKRNDSNGSVPLWNVSCGKVRPRSASRVLRILERNISREDVKTRKSIANGNRVSWGILFSHGTLASTSYPARQGWGEEKLSA